MRHELQFVNAQDIQVGDLLVNTAHYIHGEVRRVETSGGNTLIASYHLQHNVETQEVYQALARVMIIRIVP